MRALSTRRQVLIELNHHVVSTQSRLPPTVKRQGVVILHTRKTTRLTFADFQQRLQQFATEGVRTGVLWNICKLRRERYYLVMECVKGC